MKKRMMAMLLAVSLAVGMQNGLVLAAGDKAEAAGMEENGKEILEGTAAEIIKEGTCGANLTYQLDANGVLRISGTGEMYSYDFHREKQAPWYGSASSVKEILMEEGVTSIGELAFYYCSNLTSVTIPGSVTSIGRNAFDGCSSLESVTIPGSVTSIGMFVFSGCSSLTSVTIPESVTSIGEAVFADCRSLTSVTIPGSVRSIGWSAFGGCSSLTSVTIPESVTSIGWRAFYNCRSLTSVTIPGSVTSIGAEAFYGCSQLAEINIQAHLNDVGEDVFAGTPWLTAKREESPLVIVNNTLLDAKTANGMVEIPMGVTVIPDSAFRGSEVSSVTIPESVTVIGDKAFYGCSSLTSVTIPASVTRIDDYAFYDCSQLTEVNIQAHLNYAGSVIFTGTPWLTAKREESPLVIVNNTLLDAKTANGTVEIPVGVTLIADSAFWGSEVSSVTIPGGVTSIDDYAFEGCYSLISVTIQDGVTHIGMHAFWCCDSLTNVTIPKSVTSIDGCAFDGCYSLTDVYYAGTQAQWNSIEIGNFNESLTNATIHYGKECTHAHTTIINKKDATCTEPGYGGDTVCSDCGEIIKKGTVIAAKGHKEVIENAIPATCTEPGYSGYTVCNDCGEIIKNGIVIEAKGHTYKTIITAATLTRNGSITTKCTVCGAKKTPKTIYRPKAIKVSKTSCTYNGKNQKPAITVKDSKGKTISSKYYTVSYTNCKNVGEATATVTFKGNYKGTKKLTYKIAPKNTSSLQVGAKSKGFTVKWKKQSSQTTGYQLQYSTSSKFNGAKTQTIRNNRTTSYTAKKLKAGQKYYVRIRTYKRAKVGGKYQNIYSAWSKAKTVKTKK